MADLSESLSRLSGWDVVHLKQVGSTNDEARRRRDAGVGARTCILADVQTQGRGREARPFHSPRGGLYVSLLWKARAEDLPGTAVALAALSAAEAVEHVAGVHAGIKWPNDLWIGRRKLGGILLESAGADRPVVIGVGLNIAQVPAELGDASGFTALATEAARPVDRVEVLLALLRAVDAWTHRLRAAAPGGRTHLAAAWRERLLLLGEFVTCDVGGRLTGGLLQDLDLDRGLLLQPEQGPATWLPPAYVRDLRPCPRTMEMWEASAPEGAASGGDLP